jgi:hypothetical protein
MVGLPSGGVWAVLSMYGLWTGLSSGRDCLAEGDKAGLLPVSSPLLAPNRLVTDREKNGCVGNTTRGTAYLCTYVNLKEETEREQETHVPEECGQQTHGDR